MILPCPILPRDVMRFPVTLSLTLANIFIFMVFFAGSPDSSPSDMVSDRDLRTAGRIFLTEKFQTWRPSWMMTSWSQAPESLETYGQIALHDRRFLETIEHKDVQAADVLALNSLVKSATAFHEGIEDRSLHRFGLSSERSGGLAWLTYQFSHAGALHLLSNMVFLVLLGLILETQIGGFNLLLLYLFGGIAGGLFFLYMDPYGIVPMVGASGSVSALITAYPLLEARRRIRYFYFILPFKGQMGFIYLPTILIFPLFMVSDVASMLAAPEGVMGGVAYAAHIGGGAFGIIAALGYKIYRSRFAVTAPPSHS